MQSTFIETGYAGITLSSRVSSITLSTSRSRKANRAERAIGNISTLKTVDVHIVST